MRHDESVKDVALALRPGRGRDAPRRLLDLRLSPCPQPSESEAHQEGVGGSGIAAIQALLNPLVNRKNKPRFPHHRYSALRQVATKGPVPGPFRGDFKLVVGSGGLGCAVARGIAEARTRETTRPIRVDRHSPKPSRLDPSSGPLSRISGRRSALGIRLVELEARIVVPRQFGRRVPVAHPGLRTGCSERRRP